MIGRTAPFVLALVVAGCGGDDGHSFTPEGVSEAITPLVRDNLHEQDRDASISALECVTDGDDLHYRCLANVTWGDGTEQRFTAAVVCERETGRCISRGD